MLLFIELLVMEFAFQHQNHSLRISIYIERPSYKIDNNNNKLLRFLINEISIVRIVRKKVTVLDDDRH